MKDTGVPAYDIRAMNGTPRPLSAQPEGAHAQSQPIRPHILVAEDDPVILHFNAEALSRSGYQVDTANDGAAAWLALSVDSYDLLITDNSMPNLSGVELLEKLRAARMAMPVIMATGTPPSEEFSSTPGCSPPQRC